MKNISYAPTLVKTDGGRAAAGFKGKARDCVVRAISIATGIDYGFLFAELSASEDWNIEERGVRKDVWKPLLERYGFTWIPLMSRGTGCRVHVRGNELPWLGVPYVLRLTRHITAFHDGKILDNHDCSRNGTRCVYGILVPNAKAEIARKFFKKTLDRR
jgi:hypothetical protein